MEDACVLHHASRQTPRIYFCKHLIVCVSSLTDCEQLSSLKTALGSQRHSSSQTPQFHPTDCLEAEEELRNAPTLTAKSYDTTPLKPNTQQREWRGESGGRVG